MLQFLVIPSQMSAFLFIEQLSKLYCIVCVRTLSIHLLSAGAHLCPFLRLGVSFCFCFSEIKRNQNNENESIILTIHPLY